jgi:hypothetical protein
MFRRGEEFFFVKQHNEEINGLYCWCNIIWLIRSSQMMWVGYIAQMREEECMKGFGWEI